MFLDSGTYHVRVHKPIIQEETEMKTIVKILRVLAVTLVLAVAACPMANAWETYVDLPFQASGILENEEGDRAAAFKIVVPAEWNGTLVMYAHGYSILSPKPLPLWVKKYY